MFKHLLFPSLVISLLSLKIPSVATTIDCGSTPSELQTKLSFACFGTIEQDGSIPADYNSDIGYDISRQWQAGYHVTQVLKLGDLAESFSPQTLTISNMINSGGGDINSVSIKEFPLIHQQSLSDLIQSIPSLKNTKVKHFPGLDSYGGNQRLSQLIKRHSSLKNLTLEQLGIGDFSLSSIPGLAQAQLNQFPGWGNQYLSNLPYFSTIPLAQMPNAWVANNPVIARIDALRSREGQQDRTLSGSYKEGFNVPCYSDCDYVELDDIENQGASVSLPVEGIRWISGKKQKVSGGEGCLAWINNGQEPTGIHPFGPAFKVVLWDVNEQTGNITTKLFFRFRASCGFFGSGATPYFIGPVSWMNHKTNDFVVAGFQGQTFNSSSATSTTPNTTNVGSGNNQPITTGSSNGSVNGNGNNNNNVTATNSNLPSIDSTQITQSSQTSSYTDINLNPINQDISWSSWQFSQVLPANSYTASTNYLCHQENCGYSIGMFNLSSSDPFVMAAVGKTNAGDAWLNQVNNGATPTTAQINEFFPKTLQQEVFETKIEAIASNVEEQIDPLTHKPFVNGRKVQRIAQVYYGGEAALIDGDIPIGLGDDSLLQASRNSVELYLSRS
ncbi:hypothetical protein [Crocosphaera chwakensis]|nr:hypothetical protein [Crocosphaera chwakensis]